jgi:diadenosine tetraphosphate (Ap4A) HIT family hydrolase
MKVEDEEEPLLISPLQVSTAILSRDQFFLGYTLLIYNEHITDLEQLSEENRIKYSGDMMRVAKAIDKAFGPDKMSYELLGEKESHLQWHVIPRRKSDSLEIDRPIWEQDYQPKRLPEKEYRRIIRKIKANL